MKVERNRGRIAVWEEGWLTGELRPSGVTFYILLTTRDQVLLHSIYENTPRRLAWGALITCLTLVLFLPSAQAADALPVGKWTVTFTNGVVETVEIEADGGTIVSDKERNAKGKATVGDGSSRSVSRTTGSSDGPSTATPTG